MEDYTIDEFLIVLDEYNAMNNPDDTEVVTAEDF